MVPARLAERWALHRRDAVRGMAKFSLIGKQRGGAKAAPVGAASPLLQMGGRERE